VFIIKKPFLHKSTTLLLSIICLLIITVALCINIKNRVTVYVSASQEINNANNSTRNSENTITENKENESSKENNNFQNNNLEEDVNTNKEAFKTLAQDGKGILTPNVTKDQITSNYWTSIYNDNEILLTQDQINKINTYIIDNVDTVYDLSKYPDSISGSDLLKLINEYKLPSKTMYNYKGDPLTKDFYNKINENINKASIKEDNKVQWGITVKKSSIRSFPTEVAAYNSSSNQKLDRFQETGINPCEAVAVLHVSADKNWCFVQSYNYRGWIHSSAVALSEDKDTVFNYINSNEFLIVTAAILKINYNNDEINFMMGSKIPLAESNNNSTHYLVKLPIKNAEGKLEFIEEKIANTIDVHLGYLPYTTYNVITEAFKFQGFPYDWGDKYSGRDCSSFTSSVYRTFGIYLPRNTDEQEISAADVIRFTAGESYAQRIEAIEKLSPGSLFFMPDHTMMYLGKSGDKHYMIHAFLGYGVKNNDGIKFQPVYQVAVTTVDLLNSKGNPYVNEFTSMIQFK